MSLQSKINKFYVKDIEQIDKSINIDKRFCNLPISNLVLDSRKAEEGYLFGAFKGEVLDGRKFIAGAIEKGAKIIVTHDDYEEQLADDICLIKHKNPRKIFALIASKIYKQPQNIVAITGTNGKTSIASFCKQIWQHLGEEAAIIGTLGVQDTKNIFVEKNSQDKILTTPEAVEMREILSDLASNEINNIAIEASSHGLDQYRLDGLDIRAAAFSNFTQDHLDYHETFENYFNAKARLFSQVMPKNSIAVLNSDADRFDEIYDICRKCNHKIFIVGENFQIRDKDNFIKINEINERDSGLNFEFELNRNKYSITSSLVGKFQIYNMLMAAALIYATANNKDKNMGAIAKSLNSLENIDGRMQRIFLMNNDKKIFVDYAHTPDALLKSLLVLREVKKAKLIVVFGCGGNRDKSKRPVMGQIANDVADVVIITDDNPRFEDPRQIRKEIIKVATKGIEVADREKAIKRAVAMMEKDDILLIAGKGHETYQDVRGERLYFNDEDIVKKALN